MSLTNPELREQEGEPCDHPDTKVVHREDDGRTIIECQVCGWQGEQPR
jgi:hypothetical protein